MIVVAKDVSGIIECYILNVMLPRRSSNCLRGSSFAHRSPGFLTCARGKASVYCASLDVVLNTPNSELLISRQYRLEADPRLCVCGPNKKLLQLPVCELFNPDGDKIYRLPLGPSLCTVAGHFHGKQQT